VFGQPLADDQVPVEIVVPYAVELGARVREPNGSRREIHRVFLKDRYLHFEEWNVRWQEYHPSNKSANPITVLVEHPRLLQYDLFDTAPPKERTDDHLRFRDEVRGQSHKALQHYVKQGLLDRKVYDEVHKLLTLQDTVADHERQLERIQVNRVKIHKAQQQVQGNMQALSQTGKEGELRARYVGQIEATEVQWRKMEEREADLKTAIKQVEDEIAARLEALG